MTDQHMTHGSEDGTPEAKRSRTTPGTELGAGSEPSLSASASAPHAPTDKANSQSSATQPASNVTTTSQVNTSGQHCPPGPSAKGDEHQDDPHDEGEDEDDEDDNDYNGVDSEDEDGQAAQSLLLASGPGQWVLEQLRQGLSCANILRQLGHQLDTEDENINLPPFFLAQLAVKFAAGKPRQVLLTDFDKVVAAIRQARNIIMVTGAGISTSCGIPDFRSPDGLYARLKVDYPSLPQPEAMFDMRYFLQNPRPFFDFAKEIWPGLFQPSPSHKFVKALETRGQLRRDYTQNIDTLEQVAGISNIVQCHGSFNTASCILCKHQVTKEAIRDQVFAGQIPLCPKCPTPARSLESILRQTARSQTLLQEYNNRIANEESENEESDSDEDPDNQRDGDTISEEEPTETSAPPAEPQPSGAQHEDSTPRGLDSATTSPTRQTNAPAPDASRPATSAASAQTGADTPSATASGPTVASSHPRGPCALDDQEQPVVLPDGRTLPVWEDTLLHHRVPVLKPDITFFREDLPQTFYEHLESDLDVCDLVIVMGSSLQVQPVSRIPDVVDDSVPQILINREPLRHAEFSAELLGSCDEITTELAHRLGLTEMLSPTTRSEPKIRSTDSDLQDSVAALLDGVRTWDGQAVEYRRPHRFLFSQGDQTALAKRVQRDEMRNVLITFSRNDSGDHATTAAVPKPAA